MLGNFQLSNIFKDNSFIEYPAMAAKPNPLLSAVHNLSQYLTRPYAARPELHMTDHVGSSLGMFVSLPLAIAGKTLQFIAEKSSNAAYIYIQGKAEEQKKVNQKYMSLNAATLHLGQGLKPGQERMPGLAAMIDRIKPDVLCLQDLATQDAYTLTKLTQNLFSHFYIVHGQTNWLNYEVGLFLACTTPIEEDPIYQAFPSASYQEQVGFFLVKTPHAYIMNINLEKKSIVEKVRQVKAIQRQVSELNQPCIILGALPDAEEVPCIHNELHHLLLDDALTVTNSFKCAKNATVEKSAYDVICLSSLTCEWTISKIKDTYLNKKADTAISDHDVLLLEISYNEPGV